MVMVPAWHGGACACYMYVHFPLSAHKLAHGHGEKTSYITPAQTRTTGLFVLFLNVLFMPHGHVVYITIVIIIVIV
jgi:hypothetical protein